MFFKYIKLKSCYSANKLEEAAEQVGKLHASLKKHYSTTEFAIRANANQIDGRPGPALTEQKWKQYITNINNKVEIDQYDQIFLDNQSIIETAVKQVEEKFVCLSDQADMQNIHFDLNTTNFLVDTKDRIRLMDYDNVQLGNIYTDIGFAFQRLIIPYIESGEQDIVKLIHTCIDSYKKGNLGFEPDPYKIAIAMVNRALRNVRASLDLKYQDNDTQWLNSIELNIERLKQACEISKVIQENVKRN